MISIDFRPTPWLFGAHSQTIVSYFRPAWSPPLTWRELPTPDGDVVHTAWTGSVVQGSTAVILLPGLEGTERSGYLRLLLRGFAAQGWCAVLCLPRGSGGRPNRLERSGHGGEWEDVALLGRQLRGQGATRLAIVGVSLGGNRLLNLRADATPEDQPDDAIAICPPYSLRDTCAALERGFSTRYRESLLKSMRASLRAKGPLAGLTAAKIAALRSFRDFDDQVTAPRNGFAGVDDYWQRASCGPRLARITLPTTIIAAEDDPFVLQAPPPLGPGIRLLRSRRGGHVGFLTGWWPRPWLPDAVVGILNDNPRFRS